MGYLIPKDLITYVENNTTFVLPNAELIHEGVSFYLLQGMGGTRSYRSDQESAALLVNWLMSEFIAGDLVEDVITARFRYEEYIETGLLLAALWQVYKKVKGIQ